MDFGAALTDMWRAILLFVPKALGFIAILVIGYLVARLVRRTVGRLLDRFGFYRAVRRSGVSRFLANSRYDASGIVALLAYYTVLLFTLQLAFGIWGPNPVSDLIAGVVAWLPSAIIAIIIVVVAAAIASAVKNVIANALSSLSYGRLLANLAAIFIVGLGVIAALNQIGIATTVTTPVLIAVLATVAGILIVGVGGGMIAPMRQRWERWLSKAESESQTVREGIQAYAEARREAMQAEAAARREALNAPAVGSSPVNSQPVEPVYATGQAAVGSAQDYPAGYPTDNAVDKTAEFTPNSTANAGTQPLTDHWTGTPPEAQPQSHSATGIPPQTATQSHSATGTPPQAATRPDPETDSPTGAPPQAATRPDSESAPPPEAQPQTGSAQQAQRRQGQEPGTGSRAATPPPRKPREASRKAAREDSNDATQILRPVDPGQKSGRR